MGEHFEEALFLPAPTQAIEKELAHPQMEGRHVLRRDRRVARLLDPVVEELVGDSGGVLQPLGDEVVRLPQGDHQPGP